MGVFKRRRRGPHIDREEALNSIPVQNAEVRATRLESGDVLLVYPIRVKPWIASLARRFGSPTDDVQTRKLQLDALGTEVWGLLDGKRSVRELIAVFADRHRMHPKEAEFSVARFLRELGRRGLIGLR